MGFPDMKLPIQLALTWPERLPGTQACFNPFDPRASQLTFEAPDRSTFRLLDLAYEAGRRGGSLPVVMNAANETAVSLFLAGRIGFLAIADQVETCMNQHMKQDFMTVFSFDDMMGLDQWARQQVMGQPVKEQ
ncbi:MAG TPA: 1-deoxy-D-xylulose-5-phosphate reductoisomerase, partial [Clostridiales bacterium]|nr:1-deoxy-D-xylulose-5-phosphate reductoisomerase [Clostridiales bacterium]